MIEAASQEEVEALVPSVAAELPALELRAICASAPTDNPEDALRLLVERSGWWWWKLVHGGQLLGIAGGFSPWHGVLNTLLLPLQAFREHGLPATLAMRRLHWQVGIELCIHRFQTVNLVAEVEARRWLRALGYREEGVLRGYGKRGEDAVILARVEAM